jgi:glutathione S-transferase
VPDTLAMERAEKNLARYLSLVDQRLDKQAWMLGDEFSLVDCCYAPVFDALSLAGEQHLAPYPAIAGYLAKVRERRAWKACGFRS